MEPVVKLCLSFLPGEYFVPSHMPLALIRLLHGRVEHTYRCLPDVATGAISLDERDHRRIRHLIPPAPKSDFFSIGWPRQTVIRTRHCSPLQIPPYDVVKLAIIKNCAQLGE